MSQLAFGRINAYRKYELFMERYRSAAEIVRREIPLNHESRFLDVGCGNGIMKFFFDDHEGTWHGIEEWPERVACCEKLGYRIARINIDTDAFPYPDESFDTVFASHVIEHLKDPARALHECARVLKPGGLLLVATPTKPPFFAGLINGWHHALPKKLGETQNAFSAPSLRRLVRRALSADPKTHWRLVDCRGFRLLSCRSRSTLEDQYWFYRLNTSLARHLTYLVPEVNVIYQKIVSPDSK
ncbi:MAG: class I SAM-dependent methyltransferase [Terrimicrobiaceae bacterium]